MKTGRCSPAHPRRRPRCAGPARNVARLAWRVSVLAMVVGTAAAANATPASASSVAVDGLFVRYGAATGERNELTASPVDEYAVEIVDLGAVIDVGPGCERTDLHVVRCTAVPLVPGYDEIPPLNNIAVDAGDMNDTVTMSVPAGLVTEFGEAWQLDARGGPGDDILRETGGGGAAISDDALDGGPGDDRLWGGAGTDWLQGGGGRDELYGGPGDDSLSDGDQTGASGDLAPGPDILDGGSGAEHPVGMGASPAGDFVSYAGRTNPVSVDLRTEWPNGEAGEGDTLVHIENAAGGPGNDTLHAGESGGSLWGGDGDDTIVGGPMTDEIFAQAGDDRLAGGAAGDRIDAGKGNDRISGDRGGDSVSGGYGEDRLRGRTGGDLLSGGRGHDRVFGGRGGDWLFLGGAGGDLLSCGQDTDDVLDFHGEMIPRSCERLRIIKDPEDPEVDTSTAIILAAHPSWGPWPAWLTLRVGCPSVPWGGPVRFNPRGVLRITRRHGPRLLLARAAITDTPPKCTAKLGRRGVDVRTPLTPAGQRLALRRNGVLATVSLKVAGFPRTSWTIRLKAPDPRPRVMAADLTLDARERRPAAQLQRTYTHRSNGRRTLRRARPKR